MNDPLIGRRDNDVAELRTALRIVRPITPEARANAVAMARAAITNRRRRRTIFADDQDLLGDPIWDALLELFVADAEGRPLSIGSLCSAMHLPPSTGLRWIAHMERRQLVSKSVDDADRRRFHVFPTDYACQLVMQSLASQYGAARGEG